MNLLADILSGIAHLAVDAYLLLIVSLLAAFWFHFLRRKIMRLFRTWTGRVRGIEANGG